jgi:2-C-methyl-D-erythritol 4-phosphate cytidylyltransferase/2-C-methyl-D-erythritol 2,4-cyclodiphosphate synthase
VLVSAIIAAGGRGFRFGGPLPKQLITLGGRTILERSVDAFVRAGSVGEIVVALPRELAKNPPPGLTAVSKKLTIVEGGPRRQDSVANAASAISAGAEIVVVHDAARPLVTTGVIERTIAAAAAHGAAVAAVGVRDTVKRAGAGGVIAATLPRDGLYLAQTPQAFRIGILRDALAVGDDATDEAALAERAGHAVYLVEGDPRNVKITTADDLAMAERLLGRESAAPALRVGNGYDLHRLSPGRRLVLGGVTIPFERGLAGHSDADAVCHAATDAILGACGAGDIGRHFPDTSDAWKDADSLELLRRAMQIVREGGFDLINLDLVVIAQQPRLAPYAGAMAENLARALGVPPSRVSVKAKTNEGMDSMGTGESIAVHAVALMGVRS